MTVWVGLTGGIGSGKSQAAAEFIALGVLHIDADALSRSLTADNGKALPAIRETIGAHVFESEGRLNRAALREEVFRRPQTKAMLEALMFPLILQEIRLQQAQYQDAIYGIIDVPLLVENPPFLALVQRVLVIDVDETTQIERVKQRNSLSEDEIRRIMASQASRRERLLHADDVIKNDGNLNELAEKIQRLHRYYLHTLKAV
ncbi:dephospho-CoA kinase [Neisseria sp. N95_16]|uniref:Dephospho-CoA kinase n=1 Tax=Neisseria brasiliensis TaxID=2666100 RepID=A0A7X2GXC7_9NEIS|nr:MULTISPECIES: dephospho-CoA kinase [Neisseria]MRN37693.1 dephospho-CoA kinase [Neisseria brasiliensis]PJO09762.1 dephospho-CoA kinase [Neisseria sp. N95_16]